MANPSRPSGRTGQEVRNFRAKALAFPAAPCPSLLLLFDSSFPEAMGLTACLPPPPQTLKVPGTGVASCIGPYTATLKSQALEPAPVQTPALQLTSCVTQACFLTSLCLQCSSNSSPPSGLSSNVTFSASWTIYNNAPRCQLSACPKPCFIFLPCRYTS